MPVEERRQSFSAFDHSHARVTPAPTFGEVRKHRVARREIVKAGPATLIGWVLQNPHYNERAIRFYDTASWGTESEFTVIVEPGRSEHSGFQFQVPFFNGLAYEAEGLDGILLFS
jgi:hypothetical protein